LGSLRCKSMKAFVKVIHFSDGKSPKEVESLLKAQGFSRVKGTSVFEAEAADEGEGFAKVEKAHQALKGHGLMYEANVGKPPESSAVSAHSYKEKMAKWKDIGLDVDELADLLQYDTDRFKSRGMEMFRAQLDRVVAERDREIRETEAKERIERTREKIMSAMREEGGKTFHQLSSLSGVDEDILAQMLDEMTKKGQIVAKQSGRRVAFVAV
jgi:lambda repressor-like predicted transcriptional regulator